ncbi:DUF4199 family protein [Terrimonas rubra]|uniref:DUF4199 family protein n=1 Tax=Terrimonas rubra TaxID=1035890 RepID=A0ABW6AAJ7_9BACT
MNIKITPLIKGGITGVLMIIATLIIYQQKVPANSPLPYIIYFLYAAGIAWTLMTFAASEQYTGRFGDTFSQGFRCFIIVTLVMVIFTGVFNQLHPEFAEQSAAAYKEALIKEKNKTPAEIDTMVASAKKGYLTAVVSSSIFGYLITGAIFTTIGTGLLTLLKKK